MPKKIYVEIIERVLAAAQLARKIGITNLLQPGLVKEMIIADILGHELLIAKRDSDAHAMGKPNVKYEYLSCKEGSSGQFDRMFKEPTDKRQKSLERITRNSKIYFEVFYSDDQLRVKVIYELNPNVVKVETERQLDRSRNAISHVSFSENWVEKMATKCILLNRLITLASTI